MVDVSLFRDNESYGIDVSLGVGGLGFFWKFSHCYVCLMELILVLNFVWHYRETQLLGQEQV